jgi:hypothetical protein
MDAFIFPVHPFTTCDMSRFKGAFIVKNRSCHDRKLRLNASLLVRGGLSDEIQDSDTFGRSGCNDVFHDVM